MICDAILSRLGVVSPYCDMLALVAMLMGLYVALKYLAGKFLNNTGWEAAAWIDLSDLWKSLIAAFLAVGFFEAANVITRTLLGPAASPTPSVAAMNFLQKVLLTGVLEAINDIFTVQMVFSVFNTFSLRPHEAVWTWTIKIFPGVDSIMGVCNIIGYGLVAVFGSVYAQITILALINATMYTFFLPAGILLRFFVPTRDAGNFLIAMAIGFQVVFPVTYVVNMMALDKVSMLTTNAPYTPYAGSGSVGFWKYTFMGSFIPIAMVGGMIDSLGSTLGVGLISNTAKMFFAEFTLYNLTYGLFRPMLEATAELSLVSLFLPAFSTMLTFAFINAMTKFIQTRI